MSTTTQLPKEAAAPTAAGPVKSAARALDLLDEIAANGPGTQLQLSTRLSIPKSSLHALLRTMTGRGWLQTDPTGSVYMLGIHSLVVSSAYLDGDPTKAGVFIVRLKFPPNYPIPAHTHPFTEVITVLSGKLGNGMGEKFDAASGEVLNAGDSFVLPAGHAHYVWTTDEEAIVELIATGPWDITYIDPADDPRKKK